MNPKLLQLLTPRQKQVYEARTQFLNDQPKIPSLQSVADKLGVTKARVQKIEQAIIKKLNNLV